MTNELLQAWEEWNGSVDCEHTKRTWSASELRESVCCFAQTLQAAGLRENDIVALVLGNTVGFPVALMACLRLRCDPLLLHAAIPEPELDAILTTVGARWALHDFIADVSRIELSLGTSPWKVVRKMAGMQLYLRHLSRSLTTIRPKTSESGTILHATSGTYGNPNLCDRPQRAAIAEANNYTNTIGILSHAHIVATTPLHHAFAFGFCLISAIISDSTLELRPILHPRKLLRADRPPIDVLALVPPMIPLLAQLRSKCITRELRHTFFAGAPCHEQSATAFESAFERPLHQIYGSTETGGIATSYGASRGHDGVGQALDGVSIRIEDTGQHPELGADVGIVSVRSASMMAGYLDAPMAIEFWRTGDLGRQSATGELTLLGRERDIINVGGSKVDPREVEEVLRRHPEVLDVVVYAGTREDNSQFVQAALRLHSAVDYSKLREFCESQLTSYKVPQVLHWVSSIPRTPSGKCRINELPGADVGLSPDVARPHR